MASQIYKWFVAHPQSVGETYTQHFGVASRFGLSMVAGGLACFVHALVPGLCVRTGSTMVKRLYGDMASRQPGAPRPAHEEPHWQIEYEI
jgi:hypothetical protein